MFIRHRPMHAPADDGKLIENKTRHAQDRYRRAHSIVVVGTATAQIWLDERQSSWNRDPTHPTG